MCKRNGGRTDWDQGGGEVGTGESAAGGMVATRVEGSRVSLSGLRSWFCHIPDILHWANYSISCLHFLLYAIQLAIEPISQHCFED